MIEIYEIESKQNAQTAQKFGLDASEFDRVFAIKEQAEIGAGILRLEGGSVLIKDLFVLKDYPFNYFDLLARSVLNVLIDFNPIKIKIKSNDPYFKRFGFSETDEGMEIISDKIDLTGTCKGNCKG